MIENVVADGESVLINAASHPWQHIRPVGATVVATEVVLQSEEPVRALQIRAVPASGNLSKATAAFFAR